MIVLESGRRYKKVTSYETWFPTEQEALSRITDMRAAEKASEDNRRVRDAAPDLLEALQRIAKLTPEAANAFDARDLHLTIAAIAETAIARATGEQP